MESVEGRGASAQSEPPAPAASPIRNDDLEKTVWLLRGFRCISACGGTADIDPLIYTTMPFEGMLKHPGGSVDNLLMLKPKS